MKNPGFNNANHHVVGLWSVTVSFPDHTHLGLKASHHRR